MPQKIVKYNIIITKTQVKDFSPIVWKLSKVNNKDTKTKPDAFIANFEHISRQF